MAARQFVQQDTYVSTKTGKTIIIRKQNRVSLEYVTCPTQSEVDAKIAAGVPVGLATATKSVGCMLKDAVARVESGQWVKVYDARTGEKLGEDTIATI